MLNGNQRARKSYEDVILPLLKIAVARMDRKAPFAAYAFEISHHVRSKTLKINTEGAENLVMVFPRAVAERLAAAKDVDTAQRALLESSVYLNGEPLTLWLTGDDAPARAAGKLRVSERRAAHALADRRRRACRRSRPLPGHVEPRLIFYVIFPVICFNQGPGVTGHGHSGTGNPGQQQVHSGFRAAR